MVYQPLDKEAQGLPGGGTTKTRLGGAYQRMMAELRGRRYLDLGKDSQFSEAWIVLGIMLTLGGLLLNIQSMLAVALILFVVAAAGWLWNELTFFGLRYQRHFSERRAFLGETIESAAIQSGRILSALTIAMAIASVAGGWLCERYGYRLPTVLGLAFIGVAFLLMGATWEVDVSSGPMALQLALAGGGFGLVIAPTATAVVDAVVAEQRGVASAIVIVLRLMGMTIGLSALTSWGLYRFDVLGTVELPPLTDPGYVERHPRCGSQAGCPGMESLPGNH